MEKLGINLGYLIVQILNFGILMVVLRAWVYKPLMNMMQKRHETIEKGLEDARVAAEARENAEKDAASIITDAQTKTAQMIREATDKAESANREIKASSEAELAKAREAAMAEIAIERDRLLSDLRGQVTTLAIAAAQKLIGEALDDKRQHALVDEFFSGVKNGKVIVLENADVNGAAAEVTSALPLSDSEQAAIKKDLLSKMGSNASVAFKVNPGILGGLIIRVGDRMVDGSVSGQLQALQQSLQ
ncbi:MAG: F0F1 ATP synthase subunit B [Anaerolineaceae bacterium]|nr:F0F1 ATP synthase subunit B [Anaerolineaceae bacterium]